jgi:type I restriction enzyme, S subunit
MSNKAGKLKQANKRELQPKLRFPEFQDSAGWLPIKLKELLVEHRLKSDGKCDVHSVSVHKGVINQKQHLGRSYAASDTSNYKLVHPSDVIYTKSPTGDFLYGIVKHNRNNFNVIVSPLYGVFSPKNGHIGYLFEAYFESPTRTSNYLAPITKKGAKNTLQISNEIFLSGTIYFPHAEGEQTKIADCLSSLDDFITAQAKKIEALKAHKKGLMQQFFPADGETVPRLRFSKFQNAGEWQTKKVATILQKVSNPVAVEPNEFYREIGIRSHGKGIFHKEMVSGNQLGDKRVFWVEENTLVLNIVFAWEQAVATVSMEEAGMIASHRFPMFKGKNKTSVEFVKHFLLTNKGKFLLGLASPGGAGRNRTLGQKEFENLEFHVPVDLEEQVLIADCLSSLDTLIFVHTQKLCILIAHKKGLMQGLFPSMDQT